MLQLLSEARPTARRRHACDMCTGPIRPGEIYRREVYKYDALYAWKTCGDCLADGISNLVWKWSSHPDEGVGFDLAWEWAHDTDTPAAKALLDRCGCTCGCRNEIVRGITPTESTEYEEQS